MISDWAAWAAEQVCDWDGTGPQPHRRDADLGSYRRGAAIPRPARVHRRHQARSGGSGCPRIGRHPKNRRSPSTSPATGSDGRHGGTGHSDTRRLEYCTSRGWGTQISRIWIGLVLIGTKLMYAHIGSSRTSRSS
jgi:hypothetical protein